MSKSKLKEIQYNRFYEVVESSKKIWSIKELLEKINRMLPSNLEMSEDKLRALIPRQKYYTFRYTHSYIGRRITYYIFKKCLPKN